MSMKLYFTVGAYLAGMVFLGSLACDTTKSIAGSSPEGYDFSAGERMGLSSRLEEVSGIAFGPGGENVLMAVNDEEGKLYSIALNEPGRDTTLITFAKAGDYEDLAFSNGRWRVLESNGAIITLLEGQQQGEPNSVKTKILPKGEYEGMAFWNERLYVICKLCPANQNSEATIYTIKVTGDSLVLEGEQAVDFSLAVQGKKKKFQASAIARHPITGDWFILSHLLGTLVVTDLDFMVKQVVKLQRSQFFQPEGLAFAANGDLFISSEGDKSAGYIFRFKYQK